MTWPVRVATTRRTSDSPRSGRPRRLRRRRHPNGAASWLWPGMTTSSSSVVVLLLVLLVFVVLVFVDFVVVVELVKLRVLRLGSEVSRWTRQAGGHAPLGWEVDAPTTQPHSLAPLPPCRVLSRRRRRRRRLVDWCDIGSHRDPMSQLSSREQQCSRGTKSAHVVNRNC